MARYNARTEHSEQTQLLFRDLWQRMTTAEKVADERASVIVAQRKQIEQLRGEVERLKAGR